MVERSEVRSRLQSTTACKGKPRKERSQTMFAGTLSRIETMSRKRGVSAFSCMRKHHGAIPLFIPLLTSFCPTSSEALYIAHRKVRRKESESIKQRPNTLGRLSPQIRSQHGSHVTTSEVKSCAREPSPNDLVRSRKSRAAHKYVNLGTGENLVAGSHCSVPSSFAVEYVT